MAPAAISSAGSQMTSSSEATVSVPRALKKCRPMVETRIGCQGRKKRSGMTAKRLTNNIRTLRFLQGEMTQAELGQRVVVTRQTIAAIEQGRYSPSLETGLRIAMVFGKPVLPADRKRRGRKVHGLNPPGS